MTDIVEINSIASLAPYRDAWNALLAETPDADYFHTLDWLEGVWKHFGQGQKLRTLLVREGGEIVGIVPLTVQAEATRLGRLRSLAYPLHDWGSFYGPLGSNRQATLAAALDHIQSTPRDWDILELGWMKPTLNETTDWVEQSLTDAEFTHFQRPHTEIPMIQLDGDWKSYWATRSGKLRNNCRRHEKGLKKMGDVEMIRYRPKGSSHGEDDPRWDLYDMCETIARASWQGSSKTGTTITHDSIRDYLRDSHVRAVQCGGVDLVLLTVAGRPAAYNYNYFYQGRVNGMRLGFHPDLARMSPGTVLTYYAVRDSFEQGDHLWDLGPGSLDAKRHWQTTIEKSYRYTHYPRTLGRIQALRLKRWWDQWRASRSAAQTDSAVSTAG